MIRNSFIVMAALLAAALPAAAQGGSGNGSRANLRTVTVSGQGEVMAAPDQASIQLGATVQAADAASAQNQVNQIVQRVLQAVKALGIPNADITTVGLTLSPVYSDQRPQERNTEPKIVAYRASNTVRIEVNDLAKVGDVIDAGVKSGATNVQDLSFGLKDDSSEKRQALVKAVQEAEAKAQAIAEGLKVRLGPVHDVAEGGVSVIRPMARERFMAAAASAPVEPGQLRVQASVTVTYTLP